MASLDCHKASIIDGKAIAQVIQSEIIEEVCHFSENYDKVLRLAVVIVGNRNDSQSYMSVKRKACVEVGIKSSNIDLLEQVLESELSLKSRHGEVGMGFEGRFQNGDGNGDPASPEFGMGMGNT